eukprot:509448_1
MVSWYVENGCVDIDTKPPFLFTLICVFLQVVWTIIMFNKPSSNNDCIKRCSTLCSFLFIVWTVVTIIITGYNDIKRMIDIDTTDVHGAYWLGVDLGPYFCWSAIFVSSSNFEKIITTFMTMFIAGIYDNFDDLSCLQQTLYIVIFVLSPILKAFCGLVLLPSLVVFICPPFCICFACCCLLTSNVSVSSWEKINGEMWECIGVVVMVVVFTSWIFLSLGMINVYAGLGYGSGYEAFAERHWSTYFQHIWNIFVWMF